MNWNANTMQFKPYNGKSYFEEQEIKDAMLDIISGLQYLHGQAVVHRDIKPSNILVTESGKCKIADFGVAVQLADKDNDILENTQGTYHFMPPECWSYENRQFSGKKCDIWALGVTLYAMTYN